MKRIILTLVAACISLAAMAEQPFKAYCEVWGITSTNTIGYLYIDYGQEDRSGNWIVDSRGKGIFFNSMIQVINYMSERGWEVEAIYNTPSISTVFDEKKLETKHSVIMSKMVESKEEITEDIFTRNMYKNR
ncbi:MAG: hypothetical protein J6U95_06190 [Alistipes sp.]|nr:hypothetical protein [Alistipes sp.]